MLLLSLFIFNLDNTQAQTLGSLKEKYHYVGITTSDFKDVARQGKQRSSNWCWAACIQMVLNFHDIGVTQEQIVKRTLGKLVDKPAEPKTIFKALNGWEVNVYGDSVKINSNTYPTSAKEITSFVSTEKPLIVGLTQDNAKVGHAYVLIGIYYQQIKLESGTSYEPHSVILVDPWPGNASTKDLSWSEFKRRLIVSFKVWVN